VAALANPTESVFATELGMRREDVAPVGVAPIAVPLPDGTVRPGAGAALDGAGGR
jgi:hypothetical protein